MARAGLKVVLVWLALVLMAVPSVAQGPVETASPAQVPAEAAAKVEACDGSGDVKVSEATLGLEFDPTTDRFVATLDGLARIPPRNESSDLSLHELCVAAAGTQLRLDAGQDSFAVCDVFGGYAGKEDKITPEKDASRFSLSRTLGASIASATIGLEAGERTCTDEFAVEFSFAEDTVNLEVAPLPDHHDREKSRFDFEAGPQPKAISLWAMSVDGRQAPGIGPKSWFRENDAGIYLGIFRELLAVIITFATFLTIYRWYGHRYSSGGGLHAAANARWLTVPLVLLLCARLVGLLPDFSTALIDASGNSEGNTFRFLREAIVRWQPAAADEGILYASTMLVGALFLAGVLSVLRVVAGLVARNGGNALRIFRDLASAVLLAALMALAFAALTLGVAIIEPQVDWLAFEGPALLISLGLAVFALLVLRQQLEISRRIAVLIGLAIAATLLLPTDPLAHSSGDPAPVYFNTILWADFASKTAAEYLFTGLLLFGAIKIAGNPAITRPIATRWCLLFLGLAVVMFNIGSVFGALATVAVMIVIAPRMIKSRAARTKFSDAERSAQIEFATIIGVSSAALYLVQNLFSADSASQHAAFVILRYAKALQVFALAFIAALVLHRGREVLRGDSVTLKALLVSLFMVLINLTSHLGGIDGRQQLIGVLTENIAIVTVLILGALAMFDVPTSARSADDGEWSWKDLFKGTTLARAVPILSAAAAAILSTLSPILSRTVAQAFNSITGIEGPAVLKPGGQ